MSEFSKISSRTRASAPKVIEALNGQVKELKDKVNDLEEKLREKEETTKPKIELKRGNLFYLKYGFFKKLFL